MQTSTVIGAPVRAGRSRERDRRRGREMHEVGRGVGECRDRERAGDCLVLDRAGARARVVPERRLARRDQLRGERIDERPVLALHLHGNANRGGIAQRAVELPVVEHQPELGEREEDLHAAGAGGTQPLEEVDGDRSRVEVAPVYADVDHGVRHQGVACADEGRERRLPGQRQREGEDRRRAAVRRADRDGVQVGERVGVGIDPSRQHQAAARVDGLGGAPPVGWCDGRDQAVRDDEVSLGDAVLRHDPPAADAERAGGHARTTARRRSIVLMRARASVTVITAAMPATPKPRRAPPVSIRNPENQPPTGEPARNAK